jgi:mannosyltransferase
LETLKDKIPGGSVAPPEAPGEMGQRWRGLGVSAGYSLALIAAVACWFIAIDSPLRLDETANYWIIEKGLSQIWTRLGPLGSPIYNYYLWFTTRLTGTTEIGMRLPSVLAMLCATYVFYLCARRLFEREAAIVAVILFCANPIVVFAAIDVRPYALVALTTTTTILVLLQLRKSDSAWLAGLFGALSGLIIYCHFLAAAVLPAFLLTFIIWKRHSGFAFWKQLIAGLSVFVLISLPLVPKLVGMFRTAGTHVYQSAPSPILLLEMFAPGVQPVAFIIAILVAAFTIRRSVKPHFQRWQMELCLPLMLAPLLLLYGVSVGTSIHIFATRHILIAIPGIALFWACCIDQFKSRAVELAFCLTLVAATLSVYILSPSARQHGTPWKYAIAVAEKNASRDNAPVLVCSSYVESNYVDMPLHSAKESRYFSPLAYYRLTVPVVPLPYALTAQAKQIGTAFLEKATRKRERFLAMGFEFSYKTLDWLRQKASAQYTVHRLGVYDGVKVLEFEPKAAAVEKR